MRIFVIGLICTLVLAISPSFGKSPNLLPNGGAENEYLNRITRQEGYSTRITARDTGVPNHWRLTPGASMSKNEKFSGYSSIHLQGGGKEVSATAYSDYWRVKDASMPFGLPLVPKKEVRLSFQYKTSSPFQAAVLSSTIRLGTIADLPSESKTLSLPGSPEWKRIETSITPEELRWGAEVTFAIDASAESSASVWIDDVHISQGLGDCLNLSHNGHFETLDPFSDWPAAWEPPIEDQWVSWVGKRYRPPQIDTSTAASGRRSLRATVTYADISGISQQVCLNQDTPRPIVIGICSKLDNSVVNGRPGYFGPDNIPNLTLFVYHTDGTMQEVSPTFCLGESDHDWDYRRCGFLPQKPVDRIRVQVTLVGAEPTTSLWIDDFSVSELPIDGKRLPAAANCAPARSLPCIRGTSANLDCDGVSAANDDLNLYLSIPKLSGFKETLLFLNARAASDVINHYRYLYHVIRISEDGSFAMGEVVEKIGHTAMGQFIEGTMAGLELSNRENAYILTVPFRVLAVEGVPDDPLGFNIQWKATNESLFWTGNAPSTEYLGWLIAAPTPGIRVRSLHFGNRYQEETNQSQDFVTHPQIYAGMNEAELCMVNDGDTVQVELVGGVRGLLPFKGTYQLLANETKTIRFPYDAGIGHTADFELSLSADGENVVRTSYPLIVPSAIETVLDQEYYFPEETEAKAEIHNRFHPLPDRTRISLRVHDLVSNTTAFQAEHWIGTTTSTLSFPIERLRVNELPVQDYSVEISAFKEDGSLLGSHSVPFGRINHTKRRPLPPIESIRVDDKGRIIINEDFRFFPIVPSVSVMDWDEAIHLGANINRTYYRSIGDSTALLEEVDETWDLGAYTLTIGPGPNDVDDFEREADRLLPHPGFLACYAKQFYYWNRTEEDLQYRKLVERVVQDRDPQTLVIWGHHDSSFLYDLDLPKESIQSPLVGYCYVKIMGRPGSGWRNAPFLTRMEQVLDPHKFKLAEVNYYVSYHDDEIVPEHFKTYHSIRGDDWRGFRNESYLAVIYGANGLYHYICVQKGGLQRLRGWFQELNFMWPVFVADDAETPLAVFPANSMIEARLKEWNGKYYLLTANASEKPQHAVITLPKLNNMKVRKLFDRDGEMEVNADSIRDAWGETDAFVYEISP